MKTKEQIIPMLYARLAEYEARLGMLNNAEIDGNPDTSLFISWQTSLCSKLATEIRLLADILDEELPEDLWEKIEEI